MENKKGPVILIVDDEKSLLDHLDRYLRGAGYDSIKTASNLAQAKYQLAHHSVDLIILDLMLPDGSGMDLLKSVRQRSHMPVIILSALDGIDDRREGFESEADDYIVKPFLAEDLLWRIEAVLRRSFREEKGKLVDLNGALFDLSKGTITRGNNEEKLTAKQFKILSLLADNLNHIVSIDQIIESVWEETFGYENTLITHIYRLREKLEDDPSNPKRLVTVKGLGYKLVGKS
ncbi:putative sensory transduction protein RegX3 [Aedoeadaptatus nemausensis]|uniref:Putative sensory transduction protein RegX3 n=1 Tax=Aedoeadaptatus nemausensis TaxID=2582829 RepID=A0A6V6XZW1_9FIRM|nr:response regulator transcription factor [Peptoniphilus nemausensis]CAC9924968.1 putative sensory transduction protein RegX3 [Peptoniphilus nemausensis]